MTSKYFVKNFGKLLKVKRLILGMSQERLGAKALSRDKSAISRYENGKYETISPEIIQALSDAVKIDKDELTDCFKLTSKAFHQKYFNSSDNGHLHLRSGWNAHPNKMELFQRRPSELLVSKNRAIKYLDSLKHLDEIDTWCHETVPALQGRLYTAPAGFGKTRFGIEIEIKLKAKSWRAGFLSSEDINHNSQNILDDILQRSDNFKGVLIIIDSAESESKLIERLCEKICQLTEDGFIRKVILFSRTDIGWWKGVLNNTYVSSLFGGEPCSVLETELNAKSKAKLYSLGVEAFEKVLTELGHISKPSSSDNEEAELSKFQNPLEVLMAAYLNVLGQPSKQENLLKNISLAEISNWKRVIDQRNGGDLPDQAPELTTMLRLLSQISFLGEVSTQEAYELLDVDPRSCKLTLTEKERAVSTLLSIYGRSSTEETNTIGSIKPDILNEYMAVECLKTHDFQFLIPTLHYLYEKRDSNTWICNFIHFLEVSNRALKVNYKVHATDEALIHILSSITSVETSFLNELNSLLPRRTIFYAQFKKHLTQYLLSLETENLAFIKRLNEACIASADCGYHNDAFIFGWNGLRKLIEIKSQLDASEFDALFIALMSALSETRPVIGPENETFIHYSNTIYNFLSNPPEEVSTLQFAKFTLALCQLKLFNSKEEKQKYVGSSIKALSKKPAHDSEAKIALSQLYFQSATLLLDKENPKPSYQKLKLWHDLMMEVQDENPQRGNLAISQIYINWAKIYFFYDEIKEAIEMLSTAIWEFKGLIKLGLPGYKIDLAEAHLFQANILIDMGLYEEGYKEAMEGAGIYADLSDQFSPYFQYEFANALAALSEIHSYMGNFELASGNIDFFCKIHQKYFEFSPINFFNLFFDNLDSYLTNAFNANNFTAAEHLLSQGKTLLIKMGQYTKDHSSKIAFKLEYYENTISRYEARLSYLNQDYQAARTGYASLIPNLQAQFETKSSLENARQLIIAITDQSNTQITTGDFDQSLKDLDIALNISKTLPDFKHEYPSVFSHLLLAYAQAKNYHTGNLATSIKAMRRSVHFDRLNKSQHAGYNKLLFEKMSLLIELMQSSRMSDEIIEQHLNHYNFNHSILKLDGDHVRAQNRMNIISIHLSNKSYEAAEKHYLNLVCYLNRHVQNRNLDEIREKLIASFSKTKLPLPVFEQT